MKFYALHSPRGFSNEYNVIAFDDIKSRKAFVADHDACAITRAEARNRLAIKLDPGTLEMRGGNCYLKTQSKYFDDSAEIDQCRYWLGSQRHYDKHGNEIKPYAYSDPVGL